jgi:DHA1 family tetracycline resistance protein-like MFS transporter
MTPAEAPARTLGTNAFLFVIVCATLNSMAFGIIMPVVPQLVQDLMGITAEDSTPWLGALSVTYATMSFLMGPLLGALSDQYGRRPILLTSIGTLGIDFLILALANSMPILFLGRALAGMSGATFSTCNAYIADTTTPEQRGRAFGMMGASFGFGFIVGPVLGGLLGDISARAPFYAAAALCLLNFLYGLFVLPESLAPSHRRKVDLARANPFGAFKHFSKLPHVAWFLLALLFYNIAHAVFPATWSVYGQIRYDWTPREIGFSLGVVGLVMAGVQAGLTGAILKRLGGVRTALLGLSVTIATMLCWSLASEGWMAYPIIIMGGLGGLISPALNTLMSNVTPKNAQGELQGAAGSLMSLSMIIGPLAMTGTLWAFTHEGAPVHFPGAAFLLAAIFTALAVPLFLQGVAANAAALKAQSEK